MNELPRGTAVDEGFDGLKADAADAHAKLVATGDEIAAARAARGLPDKPEPVKIDSERFNIAIVKNQDALKDAARDKANEAMTEDAEISRSFWKQLGRKIWRHNLAKEYFTQQEVDKSLEKMKADRSLFAGTEGAADAQAAMEQRVLDRFLNEHEEVIHEAAGESRGKAAEAVEQTIKGQLGEFLKNTAGKTEAETATAEAAFGEDMKRAIKDALGEDFTDADFATGLQHTSNYLEVAKQMREALDAQEFAPERLDAEVQTLLNKTDIIVGEAKTGVRTEQERTWTERFESTRVGALLARTVPPGAIAAGASMAAFATNSAWAKAGFLFGGMAGLGAVAGAREARRIKAERAQHFRERAMGLEGSWQEGDRRKKLEATEYATADALLSISSLEIHHDNLAPDPEEIPEDNKERALADLVRINHLIEYGDKNKTDLIRFSEAESVEDERYQLDVARARLRVRLKELYGADFDGLYEQQNSTFTESDDNPTKGIAAKDADFRRLQLKEAGKVGLKAAAMGGAIGGALSLAAEGIQYAFQDTEVTAAGPIIPHTFGATTLNLPEGITPRELGSGQYELTMPDGTAITVETDASGRFTDESLTALQSVGIAMTNPDGTDLSTCAAERVTTTSAEAVADPANGFEKVERVRWYDNNTPAPNFDKNELGLRWGGVDGTGIDADGNYVYDISNMTSGGSVHSAHSPDVIAEARAGNIKLFLSLSGDTQGDVVAVDVKVIGAPPNEQIVAVIDDPDIKAMFFENSGDGDPFTGKFAEIGHVVGTKPDGTEQIAIFATDTGPGKDSVSFMRDCSETSHHYDFARVPDEAEGFNWDPFLVPAPLARRPLERMGNKAQVEEEDVGKNKENGEVNPELLQEVKELRSEALGIRNNHQAQARILAEKKLRNERGMLTMTAMELGRWYRSESYNLPGPLSDKLNRVQIFAGALSNEELGQEKDLLQKYKIAYEVAVAASEEVTRTEDIPSPEDLEVEKANIVHGALWKNSTALKFDSGGSPAGAKRAEKALGKLTGPRGERFSLMKESASSGFQMLRGKDLKKLAEGLRGQITNPDSYFTETSYNDEVDRLASKIDNANEDLETQVVAAIDSLEDDKRAEVLLAMQSKGNGGAGINFVQALQKFPELQSAYDTEAKSTRQQLKVVVNEGFRDFARGTKAGTERDFSTGDEKREYFDDLGLEAA